MIDNMEKEKTTPSLSREGRGGSPVGGSALVSIIMGSTSDLPVMEKAMKFLDEMEVPFEVNALSAHRTPEAVEQFAKGAAARGIKVIIAGAGMAAACITRCYCCLHHTSCYRCSYQR